MRVYSTARSPQSYLNKTNKKKRFPHQEESGSPWILELHCTSNCVGSQKSKPLETQTRLTKPDYGPGGAPLYGIDNVNTELQHVNLLKQACIHRLYLYLKFREHKLQKENTK